MDAEEPSTKPGSHLVTGTSEYRQQGGNSGDLASANCFLLAFCGHPEGLETSRAVTKQLKKGTGAISWRNTNKLSAALAKRISCRTP
jgi:hypothetical protein